VVTVNNIANIVNWQERAACRGADTDLFYPPRGYNIHDYKKVIETYCDNCPVRQDCLDYAIENCENLGIWGGLPAIGRRRLKASSRKLQRSA
jgi:WhiB family redox-sensing transcriptional regulator